jgi:hypothetical protein
MTGFFFDIQGVFDARFSGRYLSILLRELGRREPRRFADMFNLPREIKSALLSGELQVDREVRFKRGKRTRIADLALSRSGDPLVFFEIKEDDIGAEGNLKQLGDYINVINKANARTKKHFVHVSRYLPSNAEQKLLWNAKSAGLSVHDFRYRDLHKFLSGSVGGTVSAVAHEYLEDIGVASYSTIDFRPDKQGKQVAFMLAQMLGFPHQHNLGSFL